MHVFVERRVGAPESYQNKADGDDLVVHVFPLKRQRIHVSTARLSRSQLAPDCAQPAGPWYGYTWLPLHCVSAVPKFDFTSIL